MGAHQPPRTGARRLPGPPALDAGRGLLRLQRQRPHLAAPTEGWGEYSPQAQEGCDDSTLTLYRRSIALRRKLGLGRGSVEWLDSEPGVLLLRNGTTAIVLNTTEQPVTIEGVGRTLITSWRRSETDESDAANTVEAAGAVVVPPNGACWLDDSAGGTDGGDPR